MSTTAPAPEAAPAPADDRPAETAVIPTVPVRRSILRPDLPASQAGPTPFEGCRGQAVTEELAAVSPQARPSRRRASWRTRARRHLRAALTGTLLAVVAVTGLSAYATQGVAEARSNAPGQARTTCR